MTLNDSASVKMWLCWCRIADYRLRGQLWIFAAIPGGFLSSSSRRFNCWDLNSCWKLVKHLQFVLAVTLRLHQWLQARRTELGYAVFAHRYSSGQYPYFILPCFFPCWFLIMLFWLSICQHPSSAGFAVLVWIFDAWRWREHGLGTLKRCHAHDGWSREVAALY